MKKSIFTTQRIIGVDEAGAGFFYLVRFQPGQRRNLKIVILTLTLFFNLF